MRSSQEIMVATDGAVLFKTQVAYDFIAKQSFKRLFPPQLYVALAFLVILSLF